MSTSASVVHLVVYLTESIHHNRNRYTRPSLSSRICYPYTFVVELKPQHNFNYIPHTRQHGATHRRRAKLEAENARERPFENSRIRVCFIFTYTVANRTGRVQDAYVTPQPNPVQEHVTKTEARAEERHLIY